MIPYSRNISFILFYMTFFDSIMSLYGRTKCEENILGDFDLLDQTRNYNVKRDLPRRAFLNKTIKDFTNNDAIHYFQHLHQFLSPKRNMLLPREFCDVRTLSLRLRLDESREDEYEKCVEQICTTFRDSDDRTVVIKSAFWNYTESMISKYDKRDYRYRYYYYLSTKMIYHNSDDKKMPMSIIEFCADLYPDRYTGLMSRDVLELTKEEAIQYCLTKIFNDFELTASWKQLKARYYMPKTAFLSIVEDDLESPDAKDYYYHMKCVIKAKDGTDEPRKYCNTITKEIEEEKKCVESLLPMYLGTDVNAVLKYAFQNFKEFDFAGINESDYRVRYFYYLSGNYTFYKIKEFKDTPLTPKEFCKMDRNEALNPRILMEPGSVSEEGTSSQQLDKPEGIK